jgi:hypothetical protein
MRIRYWALVALLSGSVMAAPDPHAGHGMREWTAYPLLQRKMSKDMQMQSPPLLSARNLQAGRFDAWASNGAAVPNLPVTLGGAELRALPKVGNYYWATAREETPEKVVVASTAYYFSNPGPAPRAMLLQQKNELEIIPQPLPREHSSYRANEDWKFLLRFNGKPLAGQAIKLQTANGSQGEFVSDTQGVVTVHFPDDFTPDAAQPSGEAHRHGPRRADFVLATEYAADGRQYVTAFNYGYGPDAYSTRNLLWGGGFVMLGMLLAVPLLRRKKTVGQSQSGNGKAGQGAE